MHALKYHLEKSHNELCTSYLKKTSIFMRIFTASKIVRFMFRFRPKVSGFLLFVYFSAENLFSISVVLFFGRKRKRHFRSTSVNNVRRKAFMFCLCTFLPTGLIYGTTADTCPFRTTCASAQLTVFDGTCVKVCIANGDSRFQFFP